MHLADKHTCAHGADGVRHGSERESERQICYPWPLICTCIGSTPVHGITTREVGQSRETRRDETRADETRADETRADETRRDESRRDETRREQTRADEARRDVTRRTKPLPAMPCVVCKVCTCACMCRCDLGARLRRRWHSRYIPVLMLVQPLHTCAYADAIGGAPRCTCSTTKVHAFLPRVLALDRLVLPIGSHRLAPAHSKRCGQNHLSVGRAVPLHGTRLLRPIPAQLLPPASDDTTARSQCHTSTCTLQPARHRCHTLSVTH